jgi:hypothetical protein
MQLNVTQYSSESISHSKKNTLLIAEASDIGFRGLERLYDDACDVGFALRNPRSGNVTRWALKEAIVDPREGELLGWMMVPTPESIRKQPELKDYQLNLIND